MKRILSLVAFFATLQASAQQVNPVPDYVFRNQMSVGRNAVTDTAAYFSIGPRYGANKGFMPPIVGDTATFSSGKRNGLLIFSVQKNKFLYWDSVRVQWSDMAGSSGTYITGTGITGYLPQFNGTTTIDTSALFTLGSRLGIGTTSFAYNSTSTANVELNGTAGGILGFKRNDSARGYLWHTGSDMELANTTAGTISFNTNSATRGSISSAGVWRLHNLAGTGDRVVVASSNGTLSASTSVTGLVDTTTISTRAWRQKGDDSLGAIIATKGSGTVTSVATGYGLSGGTITTTGTLLVDTLNISTRAWRQKGLDSLAALEVSGSGTTNYIPKFTAASTIGNSQIFDNGTNVGIGTASPGAKFHLLSATGTAQTQGDYANNVAIMQGASRTGTTTVGGSYATTLSVQSNDDVITAGSGASIGFAAKWNTALYSSAAQFGSIFGGKENSTDANLAGYLSFATRPAGGNPTERLRITSSGDVGIGITDPASYLTGGRQLVVANTSGAAGTTIRTSNTGDGSIFFSDGTTGDETYRGYVQYIHASDALRFGTSATERLRIFANGRVGVNTTTDAGYQFDINGTLRSVNGANFATTSGNVGVGTTAPTEKLEVRNVNRDPTSAEFTMNVFSTSAQAANFGGSIGLFGATDNAATVLASFAAIQGVKSNNTPGNTGGELRLFTRTAGGPMSERMRIDASGNVGIGTASPAQKLDVAGAIRASSGTLFAQASGTEGSGWQLNAITLGYDATNTLGWITAAGSAARTNLVLQLGGGEVLIGTSSDAGDYKLQVSGNIYNTGTAVLAATSGNVGIGTASPNQKLTIQSGVGDVAGITMRANGLTSSDEVFIGQGSAGSLFLTNRSTNSITFQIGGFTRMNLTNDAELFVNTTTDAGDYKLQVVGNARVGTGKLDIASNTTFGLGVSRSGTSEVAGQIFNSSGILYTGVEGSAGGAIFTGSSAYAAVIGSGANYPLQFATNNATRATINTGGELLINTLSDQGDYKLQVNGSVYNTGQVTRGVINVQGTGGQVFVDSTSNISSFAGFQTLSGSNTAAFLSGNVTWNTTGNANAIDIYVTNTASGANANFMQLGDGTNNFKVTKDASIITANPTGGTARKWRLGSAATVSPTLPNRTIQIEVDGVIYYLHAKTTND